MRKTIEIFKYCRETGKKRKDVESALVKNGLATWYTCGCIGNEKLYADPTHSSESRGLAWSRGAGSGSRGKRVWSWNRDLLDGLT